MLTAKIGRRSAQGFSLVELMTATAAGLLLLSAVTWAFAEIAAATLGLMKRAYLYQTLASVTSVMSGELRRAGYWSRASRTLDGTAVNGYAPVHLAGDSCLLYSYDRDKDDTDGAPAAEDQYGLRLSGGTLQVKTSDNGCGGTTCDTCSGGNWFALTDPQMLVIERLSFRMLAYEQAFDAGRHLARVREIRIELRGALKRDPAISRTVHTAVDIRNDEIL